MQENVDSQVECRYEEHQARSGHLGRGRSFGGALEGVHSLEFGRLLLSTGGHPAGKERGLREMEFREKT